MSTETVIDARQELLTQIGREVELIAPGAYLPSEARMADKYKVNRGAVRSVLRELEKQGLVGSERRRGWFACNHELIPKIWLDISAYSLAEQLEANGLDSVNEVKRAPNPSTIDSLDSPTFRIDKSQVIHHLDLQADSEICWFERLRLASTRPDGVKRPVAVEYSVLSMKHLKRIPSEEELVDSGGLTNFFKSELAKGKSPCNFETSQQCYASCANSYEASLLRIGDGSSIQCVNTRNTAVIGEQRKLIEWTVTLYATWVGIQLNGFESSDPRTDKQPR